MDDYLKTTTFVCEIMALDDFSLKKIKPEKNMYGSRHI